MSSGEVTNSAVRVEVSLDAAGHPTVNDFVDQMSDSAMPWALRETDRLDVYADPLPQPGLLRMSLGSIGLYARLQADSTVRVGHSALAEGDRLYFGSPNPGLASAVMCEGEAIAYDSGSVTAVLEGASKFLLGTRKIAANTKVRQASENLLQELVFNENIFGIIEDEHEALVQAAMLEELIESTKSDLPRQIARVEQSLIGQGITLIDNRGDRKNGCWPLPNNWAWGIEEI